MLKKKCSSSREKKRKHCQPEEQQQQQQHADRRRRCTESSVEDSKDDLADAELDKIGSDIEEGGLDLSVPFQPISAYVSDRQEMLGQCFRVLGERKLQKMLPDELKGCSLEEIKKLCQDQLEQLSQKNLLQILGGEELTSGDDDENADANSESQQDSNIDSTSSLKEVGKPEDPKQEVGGSGEESDVLSINADAYDSDIEGHKEEQATTAKREEEEEEEEAVVTAKPAEVTGPERAAGPGPGPALAVDVNPEAVKEEEEEEFPVAAQHAPAAAAKQALQSDIDRSVSEILAFSSMSSSSATSGGGGEESKEQKASTSLVSTDGVHAPDQSGPASGLTPAICQPSVQQLELLELEMRARAIKALMKASDGKKALRG